MPWENGHQVKPLLDLTWTARALCRGTYREFDWFPEGNADTSHLAEICKACPVFSECLKHAMVHEDYGYWAGMTERERKVRRLP